MNHLACHQHYPTILWNTELIRFIDMVKFVIDSKYLKGSAATLQTIYFNNNVAEKSKRNSVLPIVEQTIKHK
jgi:hypothetical protein